MATSTDHSDHNSVASLMRHEHSKASQDIIYLITLLDPMDSDNSDYDKFKEYLDLDDSFSF